MDNWQDSKFVEEWDATHLEGNPVRKEQLEIVKYLIEKYHIEKTPIIDIGIGSGIIEQLLLEKNENLEFYGIDGSQAMLDLATKRLYKYRNKITYIQTKLENISTIAFPEKSGNIVLSIQTLHNLNNQTKSIIYDRVINWLQPGGLLIIMDRIRPYPPTSFPIYKTLWNYLEEKHHTTINDGQDLDYNAHAKKLEDKGDYPLTLLENVLMLERVGFKTATIHLVGNRAIFVGLKSFDIQ